MSASGTEASIRHEGRWMRGIPLLLVGCALTVGAVVWIALLAVSVHDFRQQINRGMSVTSAIEEVEASTERLNAWINAVRTGAAPTAESRESIREGLRSARQQLDAELVGHAPLPYHDDVRDLQRHVSAIEASAAALHDGGAAIEPDAAAQFDADHEALQANYRTAQSAIQSHQSALTSGLWSKWDSLYVVVIVCLVVAVSLGVAFVTRMAWSDRRRREYVTAMEESERRFRMLAENVPGVIYLCRNDERYTMLHLNEAVEELTGYPREDFLNDRVSFVELYHPEDAAGVPEQVQAALAARRPFELKYRLRRRDGQWRWVEEVGVGVFGDEGLEYLEGYISDVTDRELAEAELKKQRNYLRQVVDLNPSFIFAKDRQGRFTLANAALADAYGTTIENLIGKTDADFNANPEQVQHFLEDDLRVMNSRKPLVIPEEVVTEASGRSRWFKTFKTPIIDESGQANQVLGVAMDITDLKQAEMIKAGRNRVLERMNAGAPLEDVLETLAEACAEIDPSQCTLITLRNGANGNLELAASAGLDPPMRIALSNLVQDTQMSDCRESMDTGSQVVIENMADVEPAPTCVQGLRSAGFRSMWIEPMHSEDGRSLGALVMLGRTPGRPDQMHEEVMRSTAQIGGIAIQRKLAEDDLRDSQERLRSADRLASIGTLTAGLGHDMNNVLFPLRCRLDAVDWSRLSPESQGILISVRDAVTYLQQLSDGLRLLAADPNDPEASHAATDLDQWWSQVSPLIRGALREGMRLEEGLTRGLPAIRVQPHRLTQAVLNLVVNAVEATRDSSPIELSARRVPGNDAIEIAVRDQGSGMTEEVRLRVLEPFYTTKRRGISTGLGLSLVHGVMKSAGGTVDIDSAPEQGTTVRLRFPRAKACERDAGAPDRRAVVTVRDARTSGWVTSLLSAMGFTVRRDINGELPSADVWITEATAENLSKARRAVEFMPGASIIAVGEASDEWERLGAVIIEQGSDLSRIKQVVQQSLQKSGGE